MYILSLVLLSTEKIMFEKKKKGLVYYQMLSNASVASQMRWPLTLKLDEATQPLFFLFNRQHIKTDRGKKK